MFDKNQTFLEIPKLQSKPWNVRIPSSKSLTNRAIHLACLAKGNSSIKNPLQSIDTKIMCQIWSGLMCDLSLQSEVLFIKSYGFYFENFSQQKIYVENAGTAARFITAALAFSGQWFEVYGNSFMHRRPFDALIKALIEFGCEFRFYEKDFCLPFLLKGVKPFGEKKTISIREAKSSQFVSALLMIAPFLPDGLRILLDKEPLSAPYIQMTLGMMHKFGASIKQESGIIEIDSGQYKACAYEVEIDYSSASYFLALAAIHGTSVFISGAKKESLQGDICFFDILVKMGCHVEWSTNGATLFAPKKIKSITVDMKDFTDLVPSLCVVAMFAEGVTVIKNIDHMRFKECDRIAVLCSELSKFGLDISYINCELIIKPSASYKVVSCQPSQDHRMAMAFAIIGTRVPGSKVYEPSCVDKTFPTFFDILGHCYN